jgi:hypothetical protein
LQRQEHLITAKQIARNLLVHHYNAVDKRMRQGIASATAYDNNGALDIYTWGAILWKALGRDDLALEAITHAKNNYITTDDGVVSFRAYIVAEGYTPAATPVWSEGSFGAALAYRRTGIISGGTGSEDWTSTLSELNAMKAAIFTRRPIRPRMISTIGRVSPAALGAIWFATIRFSSGRKTYSRSNRRQRTQRWSAISPNNLARIRQWLSSIL